MCALPGERPRISVRAWIMAGHKPYSSNERSLDALASPIVTGWMKSSLHPPPDDLRGVKVASLPKTASRLDGETML
ncbi:hypothetical protein [Bradyrhizobium liaoningense]|uniref:hypothetical protein n=1 Tax=Bradyrhizobium liaoningense TaxID=43992 RepID=UPI001BA5982A|nr:hypothetical protein [Bradyrhizobium liaoningense]MBR0822493.1 hypothetical protein [Bradyrhizobium liaoningense]